MNEREQSRSVKRQPSRVHSYQKPVQCQSAKGIRGSPNHPNRPHAPIWMTTWAANSGRVSHVTTWHVARWVACRVQQSPGGRRVHQPVSGRWRARTKHAAYELHGGGHEGGWLYSGCIASRCRHAKQPRNGGTASEREPKRSPPAHATRSNAPRRAGDLHRADPMERHCHKYLATRARLQASPVLDPISRPHQTCLPLSPALTSPKSTLVTSTASLLCPPPTPSISPP